MNAESRVEEELRELLPELQFLCDFSDEHVNELIDLGRLVDFPEGTTIFNESEPPQYSYIIVDGSVLLEICGPVGCTPILTLGKGELLGWSPLLGQEQLTATARTLTATRAIELSGRDVVSLCERNPEFGYQFMRCTALALAKRLTGTRLQLLDLFGKEVPTTGEDD